MSSLPNKMKTSSSENMALIPTRTLRILNSVADLKISIRFPFLTKRIVPTRSKMERVVIEKKKTKLKYLRSPKRISFEASFQREKRRRNQF